MPKSAVAWEVSSRMRRTTTLWRSSSGTSANVWVAVVRTWPICALAKVGSAGWNPPPLSSSTQKWSRASPSSLRSFTGSATWVPGGTSATVRSAEGNIERTSWRASSSDSVPRA